MKKLDIVKIIDNASVAFFALGACLWFLISTFVNGSYKYETTYSYYTVLSNLYLGLAATLYLVFFLIYRKQGKVLPKWVYIIKLTAVSSTMLTFLTVVIFLTPKSNDLYTLYGGFSFFMHVLTPLLALACFVLFEHDHELKWFEVFFVPIPTIIYGLYYYINVIVLQKPQFDLYGFFTTWSHGEATINYGVAVLAALILLGGILLIGYLVYFGNRLTRKIDDKIN